MNYKYTESEAEFQDVISLINEHSEYAVVDLETTGLDPFKDEIVEVQIAGSASDVVTIVPASLSRCLRLLTVSPVGHNLRFDITFLHRAGVDLLDWQYHDTMLMGHLADENRESYSLDSYVKELWGDNYKEEFWAGNKTYRDAPKALAWEYGAKDIGYTRRLYAHLRDRLAKEAIPHSLVEHVHRLQYSLLKTEVEGVRVDLEYLARLGVDLKAKIEGLKPRLKESAADYVELVELELWQKAIAKYKTDKGKQGCPRPVFSFNSSAQLKSLLYSHIGLPVQRNEKTEEISTDFDSLEKIKHLHPVVQMIQEYREAEKIHGTYVDGILQRVVGERIYPTFRLADDDSGMKTSRISHRNPNLGNFPKGGGLKGMFIPEDGEVFSDHDYGQLEVCIQAHYTQDKNLLDIVLNNASMHDITATALKIPRDMAKTVNFAMQYRCGPDKVAKIMAVSKAEGHLIFNKYWDTYSGVKRFLAEVDKKVWAGEPVSDLFGRKRRFPTRPGWEGDKMFRQAANFIIQSTGGQLMNNSFYKADELLRGRRTGRGLWTVHDSGLFSHRADLAEEQAKEIDEIMLNEGRLVKLLVPLKVDSSVGMRRWGDEN